MSITKHKKKNIFPFFGYDLDIIGVSLTHLSSIFASLHNHATSSQRGIRRPILSSCALSLWKHQRLNHKSLNLSMV
jgi:hypothetical protein